MLPGRFWPSKYEGTQSGRPDAHPWWCNPLRLLRNWVWKPCRFGYLIARLFALLRSRRQQRLNGSNLCPMSTSSFTRFSEARDYRAPPRKRARTGSSSTSSSEVFELLSPPSSTLASSAGLQKSAGSSSSGKTRSSVVRNQHWVFAYGTSKRGFPNSGLLSSATFIGEFRTVIPYPLVVGTLRNTLLSHSSSIMSNTPSYIHTRRRIFQPVFARRSGKRFPRQRWGLRRQRVNVGHLGPLRECRPQLLEKSHQGRLLPRPLLRRLRLRLRQVQLLERPPRSEISQRIPGPQTRTPQLPSRFVHGYPGAQRGRVQHVQRSICQRPLRWWKIFRSPLGNEIIVLASCTSTSRLVDVYVGLRIRLASLKNLSWIHTSRLLL